MLVNLAILKGKNYKPCRVYSFDVLLGGGVKLDLVDPLTGLELRPGSIDLLLLLALVADALDAEENDVADEGEVQCGSDLLDRSHCVSLGRGIIMIPVICARWQILRHLVMIAKDLDGL